MAPMTELQAIPEAPAEVVRCPSCDRAVAERYCGGCGERMLGPRDHSFPAFVAEAASHVLTLDNRLWRTVRALPRPGLLTVEYLAGRRNRYLSPVQLFLLLTVVFFFLGPRLGLMDTRLAQFEQDRVTSVVAAPIVAAGMARTGLDREEYRERFDAVMANQRRFLVLLSVPLFAVFLKGLHRRSSYLAHLVFSTHTVATLLTLMFAYLLALYLSVALVVQPVVARLGGGPVWPPGQPVALFIVGAPVLLFFFLALRRVHGEGFARTLAKSVGAMVGFYVSLVAYEHLLFFTTALALHLGG
jgi:hypothetical protein